MYERMNRLIGELTTGLYERDEAVRLTLLAAMAGESIFLLGPPGVGKSLIARRLQMVFADARNFSYLMGKFSTPDEVFGPLSIQLLKHEDRYERVTASYLPDADVVFLDEIWKASAPIRNALLTALNERLYRNGTREMQLPLKVFIGASNELPNDDETAAAFWDRFLVRLVLAPIRDPDAFRSLINDTGDVYRDVIDAKDKITQAEYDEFRQALDTVKVPESVGILLLDVRDRLRAGGLSQDAESASGAVSDRRWKKIVHLLRASALLHGRHEVNTLDCAILRHCIWNTLSDHGPAAALIENALARHAANPLVAEQAAADAAALEEEILDLMVEEINEDVEEPVTYRDEYYRLMPPGGGDDSGDMELVWRGDVDDLPPDGTNEMDLFRYNTDDQLTDSRRVSAGRSGPWKITVDGDTRDIQTARHNATVTRSRNLTPNERAGLAEKSHALIRRIEASTSEVLGERDHIRAEANGHLFVAVSFTQVVVDTLERTAEDLVKARLAVEQLLPRIAEDS